MPLDIEVYIAHGSKRFMAACHELSLYVEGNSADEAVDKLQKIILRHLIYKNYAFSQIELEYLSAHYYPNRMIQVH